MRTNILYRDDLRLLIINGSEVHADGKVILSGGFPVTNSKHVLKDASVVPTSTQTLTTDPFMSDWPPLCINRFIFTIARYGRRGQVLI